MVRTVVKRWVRYNVRLCGEAGKDEPMFSGLCQGRKVRKVSYQAAVAACHS